VSVAIDLKNEHIYFLRDVPKLKVIPRRPNGKRLNLGVVYRWFRTGVAGVKLEVVYCGGWATSVEAIERFFVAVTAAKRGGDPASIRTPRQREKDMTRAEVEFEGLLSPPDRKSQRAARGARSGPNLDPTTELTAETPP
jgi:hypothetical protein